MSSFCVESAGKMTLFICKHISNLSPNTCHKDVYITFEMHTASSAFHIYYLYYPHYIIHYVLYHETTHEIMNSIQTSNRLSPSSPEDTQDCVSQLIHSNILPITNAHE